MLLCLPCWTPDVLKKKKFLSILLPPVAGTMLAFKRGSMEMYGWY
jgi:hypothetical protein